LTNTALYASICLSVSLCLFFRAVDRITGTRNQLTKPSAPLYPLSLLLTSIPFLSPLHLHPSFPIHPTSFHAPLRFPLLMDYRGGDHLTAYRLHFRSVCDVQRCCSCSCRLWCYISDMRLSLPSSPLLFFPKSSYRTCWKCFNSNGNLSHPPRASTLLPCTCKAK